MDTGKTRSGLTPNTATEVPYTITTAVAEEFLQKMIDVVNKGARAKAKDQNAFPDFDVSLITLNASKKFKPMLALLPTSVLENSDSEDSNCEKEASIFRTTDKEHSVAWVHEHIFLALKPYLYDKIDADAFESGAVRRALGVNSKIFYTIKGNRLPRVQRLDRGRRKYVTVLIDPLRLFHHMLDVEGAKERFDVEIGHTEQVKGTNYRYEVFKVYKNGKNKKKRKHDDDIVGRELQQRLVGTGGR